MIVDSNASKNKVLAVTDESWEKEVIEASKTQPVFVDCWAEWCTPCKLFEPIVNKVADELGDKIKFTSLDVDNNIETSQRYQIMAIPNLLVFVNGEKVVQQPGLMPESAFREMLLEQLGKMK